MDGSGFRPGSADLSEPVPVLTKVLSPVVLMTWVLGSTVMALSGPFGTYDLFEPELRFVFWSVVIALCIGTLFWWRRVMVRAVGPGRQWLFDAGMVLGMSVWVSLFANLGQYVLNPWWQTTPIPVASIVAYSALCTLCAYAVRRVWPGLEDPVYTLALTRVAAAKSRFRPRLNDRLEQGDARIEQLRADGHFVEVITDMGTERLRIRLGDAVEEMAGVEGTCCHRSHWVALHAVEGAERRAGKLHLRMRNGNLIPISRKYQPDVEQLGLLENLRDVDAA